jgi:hypothetical protein
VPSTAWTLARREPLLESAYAAGSLLAPDDAPRAVLIAAAIPAHLALSLGWAAVLDAADAGPISGLALGLAIAALDLGVIGRRIPAIRALPQPRQWADHAAYGLIVGAWLSAARAHGRGPR